MKLFGAHKHTLSRMERLSGAAHALSQPAIVSTQRHQRISAVILSVTAVDIRLTMDANPARGEIVSIELPSPVTGNLVVVTGIVHWKELRGSEHEVGVYLQNRLPDDLQTLKTDPRRASERYRCRIAGNLSWGNAQPDASVVAINYSFDGLAIQSPVAGCIDEVFVFTWVDGEQTRQIAGVAMWQIEQSCGYQIGCQTEPGGGRRLSGID